MLFMICQQKKFIQFSHNMKNIVMNKYECSLDYKIIEQESKKVQKVFLAYIKEVFNKHVEKN